MFVFIFDVQLYSIAVQRKYICCVRGLIIETTMSSKTHNYLSVEDIERKLEDCDSDNSKIMTVTLSISYLMENLIRMTKML